MRLAVAIMLVAAFAGPARAAGDKEERARAHYEIGLGLYRLGDYRGALKEFGTGYELAHKPGFLLNLGQTYRKLGELREARDMYRQFLAEVRSDDPARSQAQKMLAELDAAILAAPSSAAPPTRSVEPPARSVAPSRSVEPPSRSVEASSRSVEASSRSPELPPRSSEPPPRPNEPPSAPPASTGETSRPPSSRDVTSMNGTGATATTPAAAPSVHAAAERRPRRSLRIAGVAVGAVGLGLVGAGIGSAVAADGHARNLDALDSAGGPFDPAEQHAYDVDHALGTAFFVSGAAVAAAGVVLLVVSLR